MEYKDTVNLPKTEFPMRANLPKREPEILERWNASGLYKSICEKTAGRSKFVLHDGPPYANGELHAGTGLNKILKDLATKTRRMTGLDVPYVPGWDCHGLPIELKVVSELGDEAKSLSNIEIRQRCRAFALKFVDLHRQGFKRLGILADWDDPYLTLKPHYVADEIRNFAELYEKGLIYKGLKPIYWCASCSTALAEAEVEYADHASPSVYVKFEAVDPIPGLEGKVSYVIWTTTPWTLPANLAISVHPDFEYSAMRVGDETLIMASDLAVIALEACGITDYKVLKKFAGKELENLKYQHMMFHDRICPVILGDHVTLEAGTGCVHTAPGHGQEDYVVGAQYDIAPLSPVDARGVFTDEAGPYEGTHVFKANPIIVEDLRASGALLGDGTIEHSYPHCWRCSKPVIYRATPQWFVSMDQGGLREKAMEAVRKVQWIPAWGEERIHSMVAGRPDWCISRQRKWGVPIPMLSCADCGETFANSFTFERVIEMALSADDGIDRWFDTEPSAFLPEDAACAKCGGATFEKETDILDVWFDSGSSSRAVCAARPELAWPADLYFEGSDQHRGWFQLSLLPAVALKGEAPYRSVVTHGYVVDGKGKKLSKKLGNYIGLTKLIEKRGADVVRLWVASENYQQDIRISDEILDRMQDTYRRIRNTFRYALGVLSDFTADTAVGYDELEEVDRWALHKMQEVREKVLTAYDNYDFYQASHTLHSFCTVELSSFYFDICKDRLYTFAADARERRAAQTVIAEIVVDLLKLYAPIVSFTTDEAWQFLPEHLKTAESVHSETFSAEKPEYRLSGEALVNWNSLLEIRGTVSKELEEARRDGLIRSSQEAALTLYPADEPTADLLNEYADELPSVFIVSACAVVAPGADQGFEDGAVVKAVVSKAPGTKCVRCWNFSESVGVTDAHPDICRRCVSQLGEGVE